MEATCDLFVSKDLNENDFRNFYWLEEKKKDSSYLTTISSPLEYNQFTRDYFVDPKGKREKMQSILGMR
ncbi:hypothetical protein PGC35_10025 [Psychrobacillus sp. PGGUH221]|uniref:hypothetical protein n=1 Tax=Psychrobacillus sp. PGGUH221 TaxID=3020058 RepID=UPI0035C786FD